MCCSLYGSIYAIQYIKSIINQCNPNINDVTSIGDEFGNGLLKYFGLVPAFSETVVMKGHDASYVLE